MGNGTLLKALIQKRRELRREINKMFEDLAEETGLFRRDYFLGSAKT